MDTELKVSIIMPVYGVEDYVGKAIESIQAQTLTDFEFLIVDDGTKDNSGVICDTYAAKDSRLHVIHKENGGAPSARNVAIDMVQGKYIYFMDSDDWVEPTMLEDMVAQAESTQAQLVISGYYIDTYCKNERKFVQVQTWKDHIFPSQQEFRENAHLLFDNNLLYTPWNKLYLADYIRDNSLYFPITFWDDFPFNLSVIRDIERVVVTSEKYYHFIRQRSESETAKYRADMYSKREEEHSWMVDLYRHWNLDTPAAKEFVARRYVERIIGCVENVTNKNCTLDKKEKKRQIKAIITDKKLTEAIRLAKPRSCYMKCLLLPVKWCNTTLTYWEGKIISTVKSKSTYTFAKLKAGR